MATLSTFTFFRDLPMEVRLLILKFACCQQRNIDVSYRSFREGDNNVGRGSSSNVYSGASMVTHTKPPSILHVNREFREEALKYYSYVDFSREVFGGPRKGSQLYINWKRDRLCFSSMIDFMIRGGAFYDAGTLLSEMQVRKTCLKNGLKYLGWNIGDIETLGAAKNYNSLAQKTKELLCTLPWSHKIDGFVIFHNKGTENSNSRREIVEFGSTPLLSRGNKTWLHGMRFNTAANVLQGIGAHFLARLDDLDRRWWGERKFLGQEATMHAFEQWQEARKAVNRIRLICKVEKVEPATT
ncbi:uncharacterized protein EAE97_005448 [Botrytis byssoidea]|uniref:2EXR domain-containing protein n=1 Tax=Botrytis byssoidea TaxID=139641 RepID=A0A9P5IN88_9HELO|nr:uncharacterized protein EAE97_005448 [Botrytis byssoidea]KAF7944815.1 hypothetical protein EAE97_005448 [Botrytis byssoidea]